MHQCQDCENMIPPNRFRCHYCHQRIQEDPEMQMFVAVMDLVKERVAMYSDLIQNRILMVKEDIISCVSEAIFNYKQTIVQNLAKINSYMDIEDQYYLDDDMMDIPDPQNIIEYLDIPQMQFNLDSNEVQEGFRQVLRGNYVMFRELIKCTGKPPADIGDIA
ncbi:unnamed protein product [Blepharisma stoltei]|uniref:Uncharacterized protein n=1 Tax=Blepharisma stoltei TaxID=1481888 RepID=A0AAU9JBL5_9CILI|nr:unnamed protein product [Blepharisma stoltei]